MPACGISAANNNRQVSWSIMVNSMSLEPVRKIRSREITEADIGGAIDLLTRSFLPRSCDYWRRAFEKLKIHHTPDGLPRYGHLLECDGAIVGVILQISSSIPAAANATITRCNLSSWCVEPT